MFAKIVIIFILIGIFFALGSGLYFLVQEGSESNKTIKALTWRIILTIVLLSFLVIGAYLGWFHPNQGF